MLSGTTHTMLVALTELTLHGVCSVPTSTRIALAFVPNPVPEIVIEAELELIRFSGEEPEVGATPAGVDTISAISYSMWLILLALYADPSICYP